MIRHEDLSYWLIILENAGVQLESFFSFKMTWRAGSSGGTILCNFT